MEKKHPFVEKETDRLRLADVANLLYNWEAEERGEEGRRLGISALYEWTLMPFRSGRPICMQARGKHSPHDAIKDRVTCYR